MQNPQKLNPIIIIPARLAATRLPNKPLADIHGQPMIVHVWRRAIEANIAPVLVACDHESIAAAIRAVGGQAVLTDPDLPSGSDRVYAALMQIDAAGMYNCVINLQGDMPVFAPELLPELLRCLRKTDADIATLAALFADPAEAENPNKVKIALSRMVNSDFYRAHYFSRAAIPHGTAPRYHHLGIYAYRRAALTRFIALPPSDLEKSEKLEQLRALADNMTISVAVVDTIPIGVDTPEDLIAARRAMMP
ncbi:MAG: 3-deoxy-manno-octulosonate cytidylyltransferase [Alphaproteobacteria bacterium]|nr:3-deoxy-manno-octulosonate cytidylyltransferase [Alphaproteobacteria bacterium]